jgi:hypothetical protein
VERHGNSTPQPGNNSACRPTYHKTEWALRLTLLAPDIAILEGQQQKGRPHVLAEWHPFEATKSSLRLGSIVI